MYLMSPAASASFREVLYCMVFSLASLTIFCKIFFQLAFCLGTGGIRKVEGYPSEYPRIIGLFVHIRMYKGYIIFLDKVVHRGGVGLLIYVN